MKPSHNLNIQGLQGMSGRLNEVDTGVDSVVNDIHSVNLILGFQIGVKTLLNVINDWAPRLIIIDKVPESRGIDNSEAKANAILLNISRD